MFRERSWTHRRSARVVIATTVLAAALLGVSAAIPPGSALAAGGPTPTMTASPNTNLADGQFVLLTLAGFPVSHHQGAAVDLVQCTPNPTDVSTQCTTINTKLGTAVTDSNGNGTTYFPVFDGSDPALENAAHTATLTCDVSDPCVIAAERVQDSLVGAVYATVNFGPSPDLCPAATGNRIVGSGSATAYRAMYQWESAVCQPPQNLSIGYTLGDSPDGVNNFLSGTTQYAITGPWAPAYAPSSSASPPQTWAYAPISLSGVVLAYRMYDQRGNQITNLTLTPSLIAQVFTGSIPNWSLDSDIQALNPGVQFPTEVYPFARAESSSETWEFTSWLSAVAPASWVVPPNFTGAGNPIGATETFPVFGSFVKTLTGSAAVGFNVVTPPPAAGFPQQGNIGLMDSSTAAYYGLPTVNIKRADGSVTQATPATITAALGDATVNSDGTIIPDYATTDPSAWPMLMPTDMLVPTNKVTPATGTALAAFVKYAVGAGQAQLPAGYAPLPAALVADAEKAAGEIPVTAPTPSPTPTPSPSPLVLPSSNPSTYTPVNVSVPVTATRPTTAALPASTARAATPAPEQTQQVTEAAQPILLTANGSPMILPVAAGIALGGLLAGAAAEVLGRRRRILPPGAG